MKIDSDKKAFIYIFILLILIYCPISFMVYNFKWDMMDAYFPYRYHISLSIQNFEFPFWNAHQSGGYPIYGDPQSGVFYPIVWLLSILFGKYSIYALHLEFIFTAFIAACGFYKLSRFFLVSIKTSFVAGVVYACSGIFIGNTQHLTWLISAAYLPVIMYCFFSLSTFYKLKYAFALSLFLYLFISGGYAGFAIILIYILLIYFVYFTIQAYKNRQIIRYISVHSLALFCFVFISAAFIYSVISVAPYTLRGEAISIERAMQGAFTLPSLLSFIIPFATCHHPEILGTDISMSNAYFGVFFLATLPIYIFIAKKSVIEYITFGLAVLCLFVALGDALPFREWLYYYVPFMDYFRIPSIFRVFVIMFLLLITAKQIDSISYYQRFFNYSLTVLLTIFTSLIVISYLKNYSGTGISDFLYNTNLFREHSTIYDHIIIQSIIQIIFIILFFIVVYFFRNRFSRILYVFIILDIVTAVHLNLPYTSLDYHSSPIVLNSKMKILPDINYIPQNIIEKNNDDIQSLKPLWKNLNSFTMEVAYDGYNPFALKGYHALQKTNYFLVLLKNPVVYNVEKYYIVDEIEHIDTISTSKIAVIDSLNFLLPINRKWNKTDTCYVSKMSGNSMTIKCTTKDSSTISVFQNNFPGWKCNVNSNPQFIETINGSMIGIKVPLGESLIELEFNPDGIYTLIVISLISLLLITISLSLCIRKNI